MKWVRLVIYGVGIDIVKTARIKELLERFGTRFQDRIFTPAEKDYCLDSAKPYLHFALRFAAKEAFSKALGLGMSKGLTWKEIEILTDAWGKPELNLHGATARISKAKGIRGSFVSLSHEENYGVAMVILEV